MTIQDILKLLKAPEEIPSDSPPDTVEAMSGTYNESKPFWDSLKKTELFGSGSGAASINPFYKEGGGMSKKDVVKAGRTLTKLAGK
jgi:hypothetical protein